MQKDKRSGKIALVAHCILNQNSRVSGLAERSGTTAEIVEFLMHKDIGIVQMPCPELMYAGVLRETRTKHEYDNAKFRNHCRKIAEEILQQIREYSKGGIKAKVVIGVDGSPSCGVADSGILMTELCSKFQKNEMAVPFYGIRYKRLAEDLVELESLIGN